MGYSLSNLNRVLALDLGHGLEDLTLALGFGGSSDRLDSSLDRISNLATNPLSNHSVLEHLALEAKLLECARLQFLSNDDDDAR